MVSGIMVATACIAPTTTVQLFGVVPLPLWLLTVGYLFYDGYYLDSPASNVGHASHLGGSAFGFAFYMLRLRRFGGIFPPKF